MEPLGQARQSRQRTVRPATPEDDRVAVAHVNGREIAVLADGGTARVVERSQGTVSVLWEGDQAGALARWEDRVHDLVRQRTRTAPDPRFATA